MRDSSLYFFAYKTTLIMDKTYYKEDSKWTKLTSELDSFKELSSR